MRRVVALVVAAVAAAALLTPALASDDSATAATASTILQGFDPEDIISDAVMYNSSTMSQSAIQSFLNAKQPTCAAGYTCLKSVRVDTQSMAANLMCGAYQGAPQETAAAIIAKVAKSCRINPQTLIVLLQKEQTLITGRSPYSGETVSSIYRKATGLGCPDTAPCDPAKYGLFNQIYGAAYWLIRYTTPPGTTGPGWTSFSYFPVGRPSSVLYNPNVACGAKTLTIANKATASLYYYTPYTPNASALAAGWGGGDSCGAYGNRNFFLYFTDWFGSTHYTVTGVIKTAWTTTGGATGTLGNPVGNAVASSAAGGGSYQVFQRGRIYTSAAGTFALTGAISSRYAALKGPSSALKWPTAAGATTTANGGGSTQAFQGGLLAVRTGSTTAYPVTGAMLTEYAARKAQAGSVGWPTGDAAAVPGGVSQPFTRGAILQQAGKTAHAVLADLFSDYQANGGAAGALGWPTAGWRGVTADGGGSTQSFEHGALYHSAKGGFAVTGALAAGYAAQGGPAGALSWPVARGGAVTGGAKQSFVHGTLYQPSGSAVVAVSTPFIDEYRRVGANGGRLGWPVAPPGPVTTSGTASAAVTTAKPGASVQRFQQGAIYGAPSGVLSVAGPIYTSYAAHRGPLGVLGWPARRQWTHSANGGGVSQKFAGGYVFSSPTAGAHAVGGNILKAYLARGGVGDALGWPAGEGTRTATKHNGAGAVQRFQSGSIYSAKPGAFAVRGAILAAYVAKSGPAGRLGWPTSSAHAAAGATTQAFQHGRITWTAAAGAVVR